MNGKATNHTSLVIHVLRVKYYLRRQIEAGVQHGDHRQRISRYSSLFVHDSFGSSSRLISFTPCNCIHQPSQGKRYCDEMHNS
ncbi:hypothetical protein UPYG_G00123360 [Umbra pygmaea]|uniref:Uncharacterized protein n=1 Tax=Umbra pygmaea TaxID=75934 RepID=A0ABD0X8U1_UMBPY